MEPSWPFKSVIKFLAHLQGVRGALWGGQFDQKSPFLAKFLRFGIPGQLKSTIKQLIPPKYIPHDLLNCFSTFLGPIWGVKGGLLETDITKKGVFTPNSALSKQKSIN